MGSLGPSCTSAGPRLRSPPGGLAPYPRWPGSASCLRRSAWWRLAVAGRSRWQQCPRGCLFIGAGTSALALSYRCRGAGGPRPHSTRPRERLRRCPGGPRLPGGPQPWGGPEGAHLPCLTAPAPQQAGAQGQHLAGLPHGQEQPQACPVGATALASPAGMSSSLLLASTIPPHWARVLPGSVGVRVGPTRVLGPSCPPASGTSGPSLSEEPLGLRARAMDKLSRVMLGICHEKHRVSSSPEKPEQGRVSFLGAWSSQSPSCDACPAWASSLLPTPVCAPASPCKRWDIPQGISWLVTVTSFAQPLYKVTGTNLGLGTHQMLTYHLSCGFQHSGYLRLTDVDCFKNHCGTPGDTFRAIWWLQSFHTISLPLAQTQSLNLVNEMRTTACSASSGS